MGICRPIEPSSSKDLGLTDRMSVMFPGTFEEMLPFWRDINYRHWVWASNSPFDQLGSFGVMQFGQMNPEKNRNLMYDVAWLQGTCSSEVIEISH